MKKFLLLILIASLFWLPISAQTNWWVDDFGSGADWILEDNWSINSGKLRFYWSPTITNFDLSAVSPTIALHENVQDLIVNQYLDVFTSGNEVAEIYLIVGGDEHLLWDFNLTGANWGQANGTDIDFDISEYGGQDAQIKFRTFGATTYNWNWWDIFSLTITAYFDSDLCVNGISGPNNLDLNETGTWEVEVKNLGLQTQSNFTVDLYNCKEGEPIGSVLVTDNLTTGEIGVYEFEWTATEVCNTAFYANIPNPDDYEANNTSGGHFLRINPNVEFNLLVWDNDNDIATITDPEVGDVIQPEVGITRALDAAGISYDLVSSLPVDLTGYDIIIATLGCYCLS
jgi:hypothetical protein